MYLPAYDSGDHLHPNNAGYQAIANAVNLSLFSGGTSPVEGPYGGTPAAIPGTVQAANYDTGGQGMGYKVSSVNGTADSYRSDGVDLETTSDTTDTTGTGAGYDLGWTGSGQWTRYTVTPAEIEKATGLQFFTALPATRAGALKAKLRENLVSNFFYVVAGSHSSGCRPSSPLTSPPWSNGFIRANLG